MTGLARKASALLVCGALLLGTGCTQKIPEQASSERPPAASPETARPEKSRPQKPEAAQADDTQDIGDWAAQQYLDAGYAKAPEYDHLGIGYLLDHNGMARDVYVPYGGVLSLADNFLQASHHGVSAAVMFADAESASAAIALARNDIGDGGGQLLNLQWGETQSADQDTVALCPFTYQADSGDGVKHDINALLYADIKQNGYMIVWFDFAPVAMDDNTPQLIKELEDCYALTIPEQYTVPSA